VAIKFLSPGLTRDEDAKKRFIHEAQAASALDHSNICTIYEVEETEAGQMFMVMALYEGETLKEKIGRRPLKVVEAVDIAVQVSDGLKEAHGRGIVHRDIKSANVMITSKGQAKVLDFGLARLAGRTKLTRNGTTLGTAAYMSPEQIRGSEIDYRSDIWSLGVMLYEMLTGLLPFKGDYEQAVVYNITSEAPEPITGLRTGIPLALEKIVFKCLEKDPSKRYQHIEDLTVDLKALKETVSGEAVIRPQARPGLRQKWIIPAAGFLVVLLALLLLDPMNLFRNQITEITGFQKKILVMPFENLGPEQEDYFAEGLTEEITSRLASLNTLGVISRQSALHYAGTEYTTEQIGKELGVHYILYGTLRWAPVPEGERRVRITSHLVRVEHDIEIWSQTYDHILEDIFRTQSDIARNVVDALGITLSPPHRERFAERPTENLTAYQTFLRGRWFTHRPHFSVEDWQKAIQSFQTAVSLDSNFALAYAELAKAHARMYYLRYDVSENRLRLAEEAAREAVRLDPESAEVRLAMGYYYLWAFRDFSRALEEWAVAEKEMPNNVDILISKSDLYEPAGRWEDGIRVLKQAFEISPKDPEIPSELAFFYWWTRKYDQASAYADRAIALGPDEIWPYLHKAFNHWSHKGMDAASRACLSAAPIDMDHEWYVYSWYYQYTGERRFQEALDLLENTPGEWSKHKMFAYPKALMAAFIYWFLGEKQEARQHFEKSIPLLRSAIEDYPDDPRYHSALGMALAGTGKKEEGIRHAKKAVELLPLSVDHAYGIGPVSDFAATYALSGDVDAALEQLEILLKEPTWFSPEFVGRDIRFSPLYGNPKYEALIEKYRKLYE
jgi:TolB-like protein/tetratricopeptide (TPR) repeat protein